MKTRNFDVVGKRKIFILISLAIMVVAVLFTIFRGLSIDIKFKGGTIINVPFTGEMNLGDAQGFVGEKLGKNVTVRQTTDEKNKTNNLVITLSDNTEVTAEQVDELTTALQEKYPDNIQLKDASTEVVVTSVNPQAGKEFFFKCLVAVIFSFLVLIVYIGFRFRKIGGWSAGLMAIVALLHDCIMVYAAFAIFGMPINDNFMAVLLTILGYSINNTLVIYDRIRENKQVMGSGTSLKTLVNTSINQTLTRTINTTVTTVMAMVVVLIVCLVSGITSMVSFVFPLVVGMVAGAYSSVCLSGPLWVLLKEKRAKKNSKDTVEV